MAAARLKIGFIVALIMHQSRSLVLYLNNLNSFRFSIDPLIL
jgi:hypothetical protein